MRETLKTVSEVIAKANDTFYSKHTKVDTLIGIIDKALRNQGMNADAVTIDAPTLDKKIVYLLHDEKPNTVDVAFGNKDGDINASSVIELSNVTQESVLQMMELNFLASSRC